MRTTFTERVVDLAVTGFLWAFRVLIVLAVVWGTISALRAGKYTGEQWLDFVVFGIAQGAIYAMIALGYTMVYGILRMINFAHGDIFMTGVRRLLHRGMAKQHWVCRRKPFPWFASSNRRRDDFFSGGSHAGRKSRVPPAAECAALSAAHCRHRRVIFS